MNQKGADPFQMLDINTLNTDTAPAATHPTASQRLQQRLDLGIFAIEGKNQLLQAIHPLQSP